LAVAEVSRRLVIFGRFGTPRDSPNAAVAEMSVIRDMALF